ncbi:hypothetical protein LshimejAT787_0310100 [Lyophyllum shimeji]|uniref:Uncharacterized protein n=1 Tax=Lyophyllum shimeji TaxID=47721 RepID=A0A9P3PJQ6_LYOSH|nr:hypothetical protein LshimejAT787_0310100 [Lyophyllum shimeji]
MTPQVLYRNHTSPLIRNASSRRSLDRDPRALHQKIRAKLGQQGEDTRSPEIGRLLVHEDRNRRIHWDNFSASTAPCFARLRRWRTPSTRAIRRTLAMTATGTAKEATFGVGREADVDESVVTLCVRPEASAADMLRGGEGDCGCTTKNGSCEAAGRDDVLEEPVAALRVFPDASIVDMFCGGEDASCGVMNGACEAAGNDDALAECVIALRVLPEASALGMLCVGDDNFGRAMNGACEAPKEGSSGVCGADADALDANNRQVIPTSSQSHLPSAKRTYDGTSHEKEQN